VVLATKVLKVKLVIRAPLVDLETPVLKDLLEALVCKASTACPELQEGADRPGHPVEPVLLAFKVRVARRDIKAVPVRLVCVVVLVSLA